MCIIYVPPYHLYSIYPRGRKWKEEETREEKEREGKEDGETKGKKCLPRQGEEKETNR